MKRLFGGRKLALRLAVAVVVAGLWTGYAATQDRALDPTYGSVRLKAGFTPDPYQKDLVAGGNIRTELGGVKAFIAKAPDFKLYYEAGNFALTVYAESKADTTLLIQLPDGTWVADDDSGGNLNPLIRFDKPQSGRYDIWVGTFGGKTAPAVLKITELK
jgi:hypothetical protein